MNNFKETALSDVLPLVEKLSVEEKAQLVKKLLGTEGLSVVLGNNHLSGSIAVQINMMGNKDLSDILTAIATKIEKQ